MIDFILECYDEYKKFMGLNELPKINPIIQENNLNNKSIIYVDAREVLQPIVNLYVSPKLVEYKERYQKAKLFHDFTHILDANTIFKDYSYDKLVSLLSTYSEYHASQIETIYNIGFPNVHSLRKIDLDKTFIAIEQEQIDVKSDFLLQIIDALSIIDKPHDEYFNLQIVEYYCKYFIFEAKVMYYLGKKNLCSIISSKEITDITKEQFGTFYQYIKSIEKQIKDKDFDNIVLSRNNLWNYYTSYFTYKDQLPNKL